MTQNPRLLVGTLSPMVLAFALALDLYAPTIPHITQYFHTSATVIQLTMSLYVLCCGVTQLIIGPLADQMGRRISSIFTTILFTLGTLLCAVAQSPTQLIIFRLIQAAGAVGMLVVAFAIVRDCFSGAKSGRMYSYLNGVIAFSPLFAPFIGSALDIHFNWRAIFWAMSIVSMIAIFAIILFLPETLAKSQRKPINRQFFKEYNTILCHPVFAYYTLSSAISFCYFFIFSSTSPYLIIEQLHIPEVKFGFYFAFMGISYLIGSVLSGICVGRIGIFKTVLSGFFISLLGGIIMLIWYLFSGLTVNNFIWPMLLIGIGGSFGVGAGTAGAMEPFGQKAGSAAALNGASRFASAAVIGFVILIKKVSSTLPLCIPAIIFSSIGILIFLINRKRLSHPTTE